MPLTTAILAGAPHDSHRTGDPPEPLPEQLVAITYDDHGRYAPFWYPDRS